MKTISAIAIDECVAELRAACRRPIDETALETIVARLRPNFERILDNSEGPKRWADYGRQMRSNGRHIGALANFFGDHADQFIIGLDALAPAFDLVRAACRVGLDNGHIRPIDTNNPAAEFLRALAHYR